MWPLKRRQKTVLTVCTRAELALAETRLGTLLSSLFMSEIPPAPSLSLSLSLTSSLSLSKLLRVLLVASDRNYNSHLIKPKKREKKDEEEEKGEERKAGRKGKERRLIKL